MTTPNPRYDIIIVGAGLSGLSLLIRLIESGKFADQRILIIDKTFKNQNDRTWCFWENGTGYFEKIVHHQWEKLQLKHPTGEIDLEAQPYRYKMIRGLDFYNYCFAIARLAPYVTIRYDTVEVIDTEKGVVACTGGHYEGNHLFSSVLLQPPVLREKDFYLLQHFMGWFIETDTDCFDPQVAQLMNFNVSQQHGCTFVYVLPINSKRVLVEYTLFSETELLPDEYEQGLQQFITQQLGLSNYRITEKEKGVIPMTNLPFPRQQGKLFFIGTAGGQTKPSTGYTFQHVQKQSAAIVERLAIGKLPLISAPPKRFQFYDSVLLRVLHEKKIQGADVFYRMFRRNKASEVFRFLDNETNLFEELQIMNSSNKQVFVPAAIQEML